MVKVMIFDDDKSFSVLLKKDLEVCGYDVVTRFTGIDGLEQIVRNAPDLILINSVLPVLDGCEIVSGIRKLNIATPVIFFSSANDTDEVVRCFESGGNDYIRKPVELRELLVRMKNQLPEGKRKCLQVDETDYMKINGVCFDFMSNCICEDEKICQITKTQASVIRCLLLNKGKIVSFETILNECLNSDGFNNYAMNCLKVLLCRLRKNLEDKGITKLRIETYRKKGICLYVQETRLL